MPSVKRFLPLILLCSPACTSTQPPPAAETPGLHNVHRVTGKLLSGSSPEGEEGFRSLQALGVRTVISVDGARPDADRARRFGLRYVHLPIGYDGVPREQALRIAKALRDLPGLVYLHCYHGQHRGPAAAAVAHLWLDETCDVEAAVADLRRAGTDPRYTGLYAAPGKLRRPEPGELDRVPDDFPEVAEVAALAQVMVAVDDRWGHLRLAKAAGWKVPPEHPDIDPPHEALQLAEHFREAERLPQAGGFPEDFRRYLAEAQAAAQEMETALRVGDTPAAERSYRRAGEACARCHAAYRDVPRKP
jgi:hypothetical protein